jgi:uncharacterized protein with NAD-binding domain and iron-sulfur cluster
MEGLDMSRRHPEHVAILGGGVAGLTAAHELAERNFKVTVFERRGVLGGKARSAWKPFRLQGQTLALPTEHGFRFFPGFYRHLPDTMQRIPLPNGDPVAGGLVQTTRIEIAQAGRRDIVVPASLPLTPAPLSLSLAAILGNLFQGNPGLTPGDLYHFSDRLFTLLRSCDSRRLEEYERQMWWRFVDADRRSPQYRRFLADGLTRCLVAAKADEISVRTCGSILLQLLLDLANPWSRPDRVLNGPTSDVWIDPWCEHLRSRGVELLTNRRVERLLGSGRTVHGVEVVAIDPRTGEERPVERRQGFDHYIAALPVEVMQELVHRSPWMTTADAQLGLLHELRYRWMNGVMFYLQEDIPLVNGHTIYIDSPWALTSISQQQFWTDEFDLRRRTHGRVSGVLSVDVSDWETRGERCRRPAMECTPEEIQAEVWHQLRRRLPELEDARAVAWFLDDDIVEPNPRANVNLEPLLINTPSSWEARPHPWTRISNLYLASDYVRTHTDLATMEGANEAARCAVNAILDVSRSDQARCEVWPLREPAVVEPLKLWDSVAYQRERTARGSGVLALEGRTQPPVGSADVRVGEALRSAVAELTEALVGATPGGDLALPSVPEVPILEADSRMDAEARSRLDESGGRILYNSSHRDYQRCLASEDRLLDYLCRIAAREYVRMWRPEAPTGDPLDRWEDLFLRIRRHLE